MKDRCTFTIRYTPALCDDTPALSLQCRLDAHLDAVVNRQNDSFRTEEYYLMCIRYCQLCSICLIQQSTINNRVSTVESDAD